MVLTSEQVSLLVSHNAEKFCHQWEICGRKYAAGDPYCGSPVLLRQGGSDDDAHRREAELEHGKVLPVALPDILVRKFKQLLHPAAPPLL